ncbi:hypothetical protein TNCV_296501 [Trichonephila clavipes]|nr:hypothetical protein TNCV_296501 [Trichonephila clavipes]
MPCCKCAYNDEQKGPDVERNDTSNHNSRLRACGACNNESTIVTVPKVYLDTSSMIDRTQLEAGFVAKHYTSPISIIPIRWSQAKL